MMSCSLPSFAVPVMIVIQSHTIGKVQKFLFNKFSRLIYCPYQERNAAGKTLKRKIRKTLAKEWERRQKGKSKAKL